MDPIPSEEKCYKINFLGWQPIGNVTTNLKHCWRLTEYNIANFTKTVSNR